jgi:hypothetical protein
MNPTSNRTFRSRAASGALLLALSAFSFSACTGAAAAPTGAPTAAPTAGPTATPTSTPAASPAAVVVGEADNGHTLTVPAGSTVTLVLASTYWQVQGSSDAAVLAPVADPTVSTPPMGACGPGSGCGTVTQAFRADASGRASITAARTTCGEAMQCTGTAGAYQVTIVVGG